MKTRHEAGGWKKHCKVVFEYRVTPFPLQRPPTVIQRRAFVGKIHLQIGPLQTAISRLDANIPRNATKL